MVSSNLATLDPDLLQFLASDAFGALYGLEEIAGDSGHALASSLARAMAGIPREHVDAKLKDPVFRSLHGEDPPDSTDRRARLWILSENTGRYICSERLRLLSHSGSSRPDPYDHEALADIDLSPDYLVPLDQFQIDGIALLRNGHAFAPVPAVESPNAAYWFMQYVVRAGLQKSVSIRLDPLMHRPEAEFPRVGFKMWLYGRELDIRQLTSITTQQHGRWLPASLSCQSEYTDYVWEPRDSELHLTIEELPLRRSIPTRGSRYFHAIYDRTEQQFTHVDGATRIYDESEWLKRQAQHVRNAGKAGVRVKIFRLDSPAVTEVVTSICSSYFVWNYDIAKFCGMDVPPPLLGSAA